MKQIEVQILQQSYLLTCPEGHESRRHRNEDTSLSFRHRNHCQSFHLRCQRAGGCHRAPNVNPAGSGHVNRRGVLSGAELRSWATRTME